MEHLPIPDLYRVTNNEFSPRVGSIWESESGVMVKVTKIYQKKEPVIVCFKNVNSKDKYGDAEFSISLHKFHSIFLPFEN